MRYAIYLAAFLAFHLIWIWILIIAGRASV